MRGSAGFHHVQVSRLTAGNLWIHGGRKRSLSAGVESGGRETLC